MPFFGNTKRQQQHQGTLEVATQNYEKNTDTSFRHKNHNSSVYLRKTQVSSNFSSNSYLATEFFYSPPVIIPLSLAANEIRAGEEEEEIMSFIMSVPQGMTAAAAKFFFHFWCFLRCIRAAPCAGLFACVLKTQNCEL